MIGCGFGVRAIVKRTIDIAVSIILAIVTLPFWMVVSLAICSTTRPILHRRCASAWAAFRSRCEVPFDAHAACRRIGAVATANRVTRVGGVLRRYRVDELPQLLNRHRRRYEPGRPRPERPEIAERISKSPRLRSALHAPSRMPALRRSSSNTTRARGEVALRPDYMCSCRCGSTCGCCSGAWPRALRQRM